MTGTQIAHPGKDNQNKKEGKTGERTSEKAQLKERPVDPTWACPTVEITEPTGEKARVTVTRALAAEGEDGTDAGPAGVEGNGKQGEKIGIKMENVLPIVRPKMGRKSTKNKAYKHCCRQCCMENG